MGRTTSQASEIAEVLGSYGLRHRTAKVQGLTQYADFRVKTETARELDSRTGQRHTIYGHAYGHSWNAKGAQTIADNAEAIAAKVQGEVSLFYLDDDKGLRLVTAMVSSQYAKGGRVVRYVNNNRVKEDPMASRAARAAAQRKAADVKARSQANSQRQASPVPPAPVPPKADPKVGEELRKRLGTAPKGQQPTRQAASVNGRRRRSSRPVCGNCGKPAGPSPDALNLGPPALCDRCYYLAGLENEHVDGLHEADQGGPTQDCPYCYPEQPQPQPEPAKPQPTGRKRAPKDPSRPSYRQVAEQYGDRIIKGREEFHYTWQGIAEVLHLIPRGDDVSRNTKVWGHVVVWNAYKLLKEQRGEEPVRKQLRGAQKGNGHAKVDTTETHNPNEPAKPKREPKPRKERSLNKPARTPAQRKAKAMGLEALEVPEVIERVQGRTITYRYNNSALGTASTMVAQVRKVEAIGKDGRLAMWFFADVALVGKAKAPEYSNERTVYVDQIVEVS